MLRLIQIPFSHNCIKVRRALELKGLPYETLDIQPMDRAPVVQSSGQGLVPVLEDGARHIADSTAILRHLEQAYPQPSLLPDDEARRAECWLVEDWADFAFMALTRRLAYWHLINTPGLLEALWFPEARGLKRLLSKRVASRVLKRRFKLSPGQNAKDEAEAPRVAAIALERLGGKPRLFDERVTVADVTLASMSAPLMASAPALREETSVRRLMEWAATILGPEVVALYSGKPRVRT